MQEVGRKRKKLVNHKVYVRRVNYNLFECSLNILSGYCAGKPIGIVVYFFYEMTVIEMFVKKRNIYFTFVIKLLILSKLLRWRDKLIIAQETMNCTASAPQKNPLRMPGKPECCKSLRKERKRILVKGRRSNNYFINTLWQGNARICGRGSVIMKVKY